MTKGSPREALGLRFGAWRLEAVSPDSSLIRGERLIKPKGSICSSAAVDGVSVPGWRGRILLEAPDSCVGMMDSDAVFRLGDAWRARQRDARMRCETTTKKQLG
jgi:hypothetical protein